MLSSVRSFGVCIFAIAVWWISDRTSVRGTLCLLYACYSIIFAGVHYGIIKSSDIWLKDAILTLLNSGNAVSQSINDAWLSINTADLQELCVGLLLAVAGSKLGGLAGQNIFVKKDAPYYPHGFLKVLCIYVASIVLICVVMAHYWAENRKMARSADRANTVTDEGVDFVARNRSYIKVKNQL